MFQDSGWDLADVEEQKGQRAAISSLALLLEVKIRGFQ